MAVIASIMACLAAAAGVFLYIRRATNIERDAALAEATLEAERSRREIQEQRDAADRKQRTADYDRKAASVTSAAAAIDLLRAAQDDLNSN